jgi:hypothetical protein
MAFSKREQSFCVLENAKTSFVLTVLAENWGNYVFGPSLDGNVESMSLYLRKNYHDLLRSVFVANF